MTIDRELDAVFIHVSDMQRAATWYAGLLGLDQAEISHDGMIGDLPLLGTARIILDAYPKPVSPSGTGPRLMFVARDITVALDHARTLSSTVTDVQDIGSSLVFYLDDPDGNTICIRQPKG